MSDLSAVTGPSSTGVPDVPHLPSADATALVPTSTPVVPATPAKKRVSLKPPKKGKIYRTVMGAVALRAQGLTWPEVAETLQMPLNTVKTYTQRAVRAGWLNPSSFDNTEDRVELVLVDKAIRNANEMLDDRDKLLTIETLKGTGVFKQHQAVKVDHNSQASMTLKVQVEYPPMPAGALPSVREGSVGGAHAAEIPIDAEVIDVPKE